MTVFRTAKKRFQSVEFFQLLKQLQGFKLQAISANEKNQRNVLVIIFILFRFIYTHHQIYYQQKV